MSATPDAPLKALQAIEQGVRWIDTAKECEDKGPAFADKATEAYRQARKAILVAADYLGEAARWR